MPISGKSVVTLTAVYACASVFLSMGPSSAEERSAATGQVFLVQGVPGAAVDVTLDGKSVGAGVKAKGIVGPLKLSEGDHSVTFSAGDWKVSSDFTLSSASADVVVHWPADVTEQPEVTVFDNDLRPVGDGKGRLTVAHTAVVPPADIRVDNKVLFSNIANGEFVSADVPATTYSVGVVPTGQTTHALLGPLDLPVKGGALTRVFAIGEPRSNSMDAVVQVLDLRTTGSAAPVSVGAGEAGLVATGGSGSSDRSGWLLTVGMAGLVSLGLLLSVGRSRRTDR